MISRRKFIFFYVPVCFLLVLCFCIVSDFRNNWRFQLIQPMTIIFNDYDDERNSFVVATSGCRIPAIDPFDDIVKPLIHNVSIEEVKQKCGHLPPMTYLLSDNNRVVIDEDVLDLYGVTNSKLLKCTSTAILNDVEGIKIDGYYYAKSKRSFDNSSLEVVEDQIRVQCHYAGKLIYIYFHPIIQIKPELEAKCNERFEKFHVDTDKDYLSVLILTLDSVSRVNLHRHLQRSTNFLTDTMGAIEFMGYNKLGDNTYPIMMALLTGLSTSVIDHGCLSSPLKLNGCPFIWQNFSTRGYRTAYGEDAYIISSYHTSGKPGFGQQPTDYYLRPTMKAEYESIKRTPWNPDDYICFAKQVQTPVLFKYTRDFAAKMRNKPYFGYFHANGLTHDDMNWSQLVDPMLYEFLNESHHGNYFNNTVLMLMSDHGSRFGPIRQTYIGKLEESLPFLILVFPPWFRAKYPDLMRTLNTNVKRLMSSFDIYETLLDIMNANYDKKPNSFSSKAPERVSLFEEIPENRTCFDANIPEHYCACQTAELVSNTSKEALVAASAVVLKVNELTKSHRNVCTEFSLGYVSKIYESKPTAGFSKDKNKLKATVYDYTVTVFVRPGVGQFEGTVRFQGSYFTGVLGDISRIDRYGNTSACVTDDIIRKYCLCDHQ